MPEELRYGNSSRRVMTQEAIDKLWEEWRQQPEATRGDRPCGLGVTQEKHDELVRKYGCADWYSWALENWGTKWGAYDVSDWEYAPGAEQAGVYFQTAWGPPGEFLRRASKLYPGLQFHNTFFVEGVESMGFDAFSNGEATASARYDREDPEAQDILKMFGLED